MKISRVIFLLGLFGLLGFSWPFSWLFSRYNSEQFGTSAWIQKQINILQEGEGGAEKIDSNVLRLSLIAYVNAQKKGLADKQLLTVIDYSKPSTEKRLWVFNIKNGKTLFNTWVSHGKNSGQTIPTSFSNSPGSLKSSIGVFVTDESYIGDKGYALRLRGLEQGINNNAYRRDIVIHGAWYVSPDTIRKYGQIGRSWGCPAVPENEIKPLIDTIKEDSVVFAFYPDENWLKRSTFLV